MIFAALLCMTVAPLDFVTVGDVMLGRYVGRRMDQEGMHSVFAAARDELRAADLAFGNLECVLSDRPFTASQHYLLRGKPAYAPALRWAGFGVMSLANNHAGDCGSKGLVDTSTCLTAMGVRPVEDGRTVMLNRKGIRLAILAFCDFPPKDLGVATKEVSLARKNADVVIVSWHWGDEGQTKVSPRQQEIAHAMAKAGADLVLGSHPHVLQAVNWLPAQAGRRCLVAYSLGNFVFDAPAGKQSETAILHAALTKHGVTSFKTSPYRIVRCEPRPPNRLSP